MGMFTSRWERAHRSFHGLSSAQRLAAGVLVCGIVAAIVWLSQRPYKLAMEPVLDQPFAVGDILQIAEHLTERKVPHEVRHGKVYVAADRKLEVLSELIYSNTLIGNTQSGFDALIKQSSVFDTPSKTDKMYTHVRQQMLQGVISRFPGVRKATVIIDPSNERRIGGQSVTPSALVDIQTRQGEGNPRQLTSAAVNAVTGAVSAMSRERVKITIDGASYNLGIEEFGGDMLDQRQRCEQAYATKVRGQLGYIPDVLVSVCVDLNVQSIEEEKHTKDFRDEPELEPVVEEQASVVADPDALEEAMSAVLANAVPAASEPAGLAPALASARPARELKRPLPPPVLTSETVQKLRTPAGKETVVSASVVVPRSYFVALYQRSVSRTDEPTDALLQPVVNANLDRIARIVRNTLGLKNEADVTVDMYEDGRATMAQPEAPPVIVATRQEAGSVMSLTRLWQNSREWSVWIVGGVGLLLVSMMFRRGSGAMAMPQPISHPTPRPMRMRPAHQEIDDEDDEELDVALMRQVRELSAAHPDDATRVLRDWIRQG